MKTLKDNRNLEKTHQLGRLISFRALRSKKKWIREIAVNNWSYIGKILMDKVTQILQEFASPEQVFFLKLHDTRTSFNLKVHFFATEHSHFP